MTQPTGDRTFASIGPAGIVHYTQCWDCQTNQCPGGLHTWADAEDVAHALATQQADPSQQRCGCACADGPVLDRSDPEQDFDLDDAGWEESCPVCDARGACGYDAEGRPLIHSYCDDEADSPVRDEAGQGAE